MVKTVGTVGAQLQGSLGGGVLAVGRAVIVAVGQGLHEGDGGEVGLPALGVGQSGYADKGLAAVGLVVSSLGAYGHGEAQSALRGSYQVDAVGE